MDERKNLGHLMVDLETMGKENNSVICSIGAVEFDINSGEFGREFYTTVDIQSCLDLGLTVNGSTIEWWLVQNQKAREAIAVGGSKFLSVALTEFTKFINELDAKTVQIWGNGVRFDMGILENAYYKCKLKTPWNFRNERDVRTLVSFAPQIKDTWDKSGGVEHNPIDDCKFQIGYCSNIWKKLNYK